MSSPSEHSSDSGAGALSGLRRRSSRGRTFRPRHRLSKPKPHEGETADGTPPTDAPPVPMESAATEPAVPAPPGEGYDFGAGAGEIDGPAPADPEGSEASYPPSHEPPAEPDAESGSEAAPEFAPRPDPVPFRQGARASAPPPPPPEPEPQGPLPGTVEALAYRPASPRSIEEAVLEVKRVVDALQKALTDMEEVLELVEDAEQQKVADERELQRLQELLRQMTQIRERAVPPPAPRPLPSAPPERRRREYPEGPPAAGPVRPGPGAGYEGGADDYGGDPRRRGRTRGRGRGRGRGPAGGGGYPDAGGSGLIRRGDSGGERSPVPGDAGASGMTRGEDRGERMDRGERGERRPLDRAPAGREPLDRGQAGRAPGERGERRPVERTQSERVPVEGGPASEPPPLPPTLD